MPVRVTDPRCVGQRLWAGGRALLPICVMAGGCGVPLDDSPRDIAAPNGWRGSGQAVPASAGAAAVRLYLIRGDRLVPVVRRVPHARTARQQLQDLFAGPNVEESAHALTSVLAATTVSGMTVTGFESPSGNWFRCGDGGPVAGS